MSKQCRSSLDELIYLRRYFHAFPELSNKEYNTQKFIVNYLKDFSCEIILFETSVFCYFDFNNKDIIAFRAEEDALLIEEKNKFDYVSQNKGIMHACGHDGHLAMLLYLAKYINGNKEKLKHNYLLIFQQSEEVYGGAKKIVSSDYFLSHKPKHLFALHLFPSLEENKIFAKSNSFLAMCTEIDINIFGKENHIFDIHNSIDANRIGNILIDKMYQYFDGFDKNKTRFLIGKINGGFQRNIVSSFCDIAISLRNFNQEDYFKQKAYLINLCKELEKEYQTIINIIFKDDFLPVINDEELFNKVNEIIKINYTNEKMIGDDFSYYQKYTKCNYFLLGINSSFLHTNTFSFNEEVLLTGVEFYIKLLNI